jgi:hypothetical protein
MNWRLVICWIFGHEWFGIDEQIGQIFNYCYRCGKENPLNEFKETKNEKVADDHCSSSS